MKEKKERIEIKYTSKDVPSYLLTTLTVGSTFKVTEGNRKINNNNTKQINK